MQNKAIFLDRDNTLIEDPGYISSPEQVKLLEGASQALAEFRDMGYKLVVVSNQSAIARGIVTEKVLEEIHDRLCQLLDEKGVSLDAIYYCPYHPDGVIPRYRKESNDRKPNPGMLITAAKEMDIDLTQSWCIGDSSRDIEAGRRAGCKTILIDLPSRKQQNIGNKVLADFRGVNLKEAVNIVKKQIRTATGPKPPPKQQNESQAESAVQSSYSPQPQQETVQENTEQTTEENTEEIPSTGPEDTQNTQQINTLQSQTVSSEIRTADKLLSDILVQLKNMQRAEMFSEFSVMRLMAGIVQILVLFCLLIAVWFLLSPQEKSNSIFIALGFAMVFQIMSLCFYLMHNRK